MPMLEWNDSLSVQVAEVDAQHKELVNMVNRLHDSMREDAAQAVICDTIDAMRQYSEVHFKTEEDYMSRHAFPEQASHKAEHDDFVNKVVQVENDCKTGKVALSMDILNFLCDWLVTHIDKVDREMGRFLAGKGVS